VRAWAFRDQIIVVVIVLFIRLGFLTETDRVLVFADQIHFLVL
jgi:hypothetical protein